MKSTEGRVKEIIEKETGTDAAQITLNASFVDDLNCDSLDCVELIMVVEEEFKIQIDDEDAEELKTVGQLVEYVTKKVGK